MIFKQMIKTWEPYFVRRNTILQIVVATLAFLLLIRICPMGLVKHHEYVGQNVLKAETQYAGDAFTSTDKKLQTVKFTQEHIYQMKVYVSCSTYNDENKFVLFRLYNDQFSCIYEEEYHCNLIQKDGFLLATPDMDVVLEQDYYYEIIVPENSGIELVIPIAPNQSLLQYENRPIYVDGIIDKNNSIVTEFDYTKPLSLLGIIVYDVIILLVAVAIYCGILWLWERYDEHLDVAKYYTRIGVLIAGGIGAIVFFVLAVFMNIFDAPVADRIVYGAGILGGYAWLACATWFVKDTHTVPLCTNGKHISLIWRDYIQTICFGLAIYAMCQYVNADREYVHIVNTRWMLIFFGIAILMMQTERKWCNLFSYIWIGGSVIVSIVYCNGFEEGEDLLIAKLTAAVVVVWGLVVINTVLQIKKDFWKRISWYHFGLWLLFTILMIVNKGPRTWVFTASLPFVVLLLYNQSVTGKHRLLKNFTNGILVSFLLTTIYALHYRPYNAWYLYRYGGMFHTVAYTGMYLSVIVVVALGMFYGKIKSRELRIGKEMLCACWKELFIFAVAIGMTLLTMSRTAILTIAISALVILILVIVVYQKSIQQSLKEVGVLVLVCVVSFPLVFTTIRVVPALTNEPVYFSVEAVDKENMIYRGEPADSRLYMTIERFVAVFFGRFQVEETTSKIEQIDREIPLLVYARNDLSSEYVTITDEDRGTYVVETDADITNGRSDIYRAYWKNLTWQGHELMAVESEDGEEYVHAHNSYLQVSHDFGIGTGIVFLLLCLCTFVRSALYVYKYGYQYGSYLIPFALVTVFGVTSLTEWAFHPCISTGFCFLFMQMILMQEPNIHGEKTNEMMQ